MGTSGLCNEHEQRGAGHPAPDRGMGRWRAAAWIASVGLATCAVCVDAATAYNGYHPDCAKSPLIKGEHKSVKEGDVSIGACTFEDTSLRLAFFLMTSSSHTTSVKLSATKLANKGRLDFFGSSYPDGCDTPPCGCLMVKADRLSVEGGELFFMWKYPRHSQLTFKDTVYQQVLKSPGLWFNYVMLEATIVEFIGGSMTRLLSPSGGVVWMVKVAGIDLRDRSLLSFKDVAFAANLQGALTTPAAIFQFIVGFKVDWSPANMNLLSNSVFEVVSCSVTSNAVNALSVFKFQSPTGFNVTDGGAFVIDKLRATVPGIDVTLVDEVNSESLKGSSVPWLTVRECELNFTGTRRAVVNIGAIVDAHVVTVPSKPIIQMSKNRITVPDALATLAGGAYLSMPGPSVGVINVCDNEVNGVEVTIGQWQTEFTQAVDKYCNTTFPYPKRPDIKCVVPPFPPITTGKPTTKEEPVSKK